uniref:uncharacterized protein isoform X2 n=1 Tax=Pristiophorus japonicus TaxID=55135 RepID=UPI00398E7567
MLTKHQTKLNRFSRAVIKDIDCDVSPCLNYGTCTLYPLNSLGFFCICPPGYYGDFCQHRTIERFTAVSFIGIFVILVLIITLCLAICFLCHRERKHHRLFKQMKNSEICSKRLPVTRASKSSRSVCLHTCMHTEGYQEKCEKRDYKHQVDSKCLDYLLCATRNDHCKYCPEFTDNRENSSCEMPGMLTTISKHDQHSLMDKSDLICTDNGQNSSVQMQVTMTTISKHQEHSQMEKSDLPCSDDRLNSPVGSCHSRSTLVQIRRSICSLIGNGSAPCHSDCPDERSNQQNLTVVSTQCRHISSGMDSSNAECQSNTTACELICLERSASCTFEDSEDSTSTTELSDQLLVDKCDAECQSNYPDLFENGGAAMFKVVSFDTPTGAVLAVTFASKVKSNYQIDWKAVQREPKGRILVTDIDQCKDKLWCNTPGAPYNYVEVILQNLDETRKFVKTINIEPLKYQGYDSAVMKEKHGCAAHPCMNNGKCILKPESTLGYICICSSGYSGDFCQCSTSTNTSTSSFLTSGCVVVLLLLFALGYLIYLHFCKERKPDNTTRKITEKRQPHSKQSSEAPKHRSSEPTVSTYNDSELPTENERNSPALGTRKDDQTKTGSQLQPTAKNVRFEVEAVRTNFDKPGVPHDKDPGDGEIRLSKKYSSLKIHEDLTKNSAKPTADGTEPSEDNRSSSCTSKGPSKEMIQAISEDCNIENGEAGIQCECQCKYFVDSMPSSDSNSMTNRNLPPSSQSDSTKPSILKEDDFENATACGLANKGWEISSPMANEDLLDRKHYYLVSIDKLKSATHGEKFQTDGLPTQTGLVDEYCSETSSQAILQSDVFNCDCDTSSQSTDSSCSCAEESTYCALNNIYLQDNCDTLVFIPRRPTDSNIPQVHAVQDDCSEKSCVKEQKLVFPRHSKSGAVIYRLCEPEAVPKD